VRARAYGSKAIRPCRLSVEKSIRLRVTSAGWNERNRVGRPSGRRRTFETLDVPLADGAHRHRQAGTPRRNFGPFTPKHHLNQRTPDTREQVETAASRTLQNLQTSILGCGREGPMASPAKSPSQSWLLPMCYPLGAKGMIEALERGYCRRNLEPATRLERVTC